MNFKPDTRRTTYKLFKQESRIPPRIIFSSIALKWIEALIDAHDGEVGFYAVVDKPEANVYIIRDIFYPKHDLANGGTCEISTEGETDIMNYLLDKGRVDDITKMRFWGHVHPMGFTEPSHQDETQSIERMNQTQSYFIRAICTKYEISISFFDYKNQVRFDNIEWEIQEDESDNIIESKLASIETILSVENADIPSEKANLILKTLLEDSEMEAIKRKVAILKKENIQEPKISRSQQTNMFNTRRYKRRILPYYGSSETSAGKNGIDADLLNPSEVASLMSDIDNEVTTFQEFHKS